MSQANFNDEGQIPTHRKPRADLYTAMLAGALIALIIGCICLYLELDVYQFKFSGGPTVSRAAPATVAVDAVCAATNVAQPPSAVWAMDAA